MAASLRLVEDYESMRPSSEAFERVVFSRPDILYQYRMGPWCGYDADTWYIGDRGIVPDMFWVLPRRFATSVLRDSLRTLVDCDWGQPCCNSSSITGRSLWIPDYWSAHHGFRVSYNSLMGFGTVARNPLKSRKKEERRDCTLHVGCWGLGWRDPELIHGS